MIKIFIPTLNRLTQQDTWDRMPNAVRDNTVLVCPESEVLYHQKAGRNALACDCATGLSPKRQWIKEYCDTNMIRYHAQVDDDLLFLRRKDQSAWNLRQCVPDDLVDLFYDIEEKLKEGYPLVGVSDRGGNNRYYPARFVTCTRATRIHAYDLKVFNSLNLQLHDPSSGQLFLQEDFHTILSVLESGFPNCLITDWATDQRSSNAEGGCSAYRNYERMKATVEWLSAKHPGFVKIVTKYTKSKGWEGCGEVTADGMQSRPDVTIQWKKAYEAGCKRLIGA